MSDRLEQSRMLMERALRRASNLFSCNGVPLIADQEQHEQEIAYVANLFTIAAALSKRAIQEAL